MPLHPSGRSWEISREQVTVIKVIGKGAFSQVAQAIVRDMRSRRENITVAVKMLKGKYPLIFTIHHVYYLVIACRRGVFFFFCVCQASGWKKIITFFAPLPSRKIRPPHSPCACPRSPEKRQSRAQSPQALCPAAGHQERLWSTRIYYPRISSVERCKPLRGS